jgi:outer membrane murein-binding lipoprotein Lpp
MTPTVLEQLKMNDADLDQELQRIRDDVYLEGSMKPHQAAQAQQWHRERQQQLLGELSRQVTTVPPKCDHLAMAVQAARETVRKAQAAHDQAAQAALARIAKHNPSETTARYWYEDATAELVTALKEAQARLEAAEALMGHTISTWETLQAIEAAAPGRRQQAEQAYQAALRAVDDDLEGARARFEYCTR